MFLSAPERTMRASSQRREAADDPLMALVNVVREPRGDAADGPLMALVNVVREPRGDDQRSRTRWRLEFSVLH